MCRKKECAETLLNDPHGDNKKAALPLYYKSRQTYLSDHRPVLGIYKVQTVRIDSKKKEELRH